MRTLPESPTVLALGAHPDDVELLCGGTLALLKAKGWTIVMATMTAGDLGSATLARDAIARLRRQEARNAARVLGAQYRSVDAEDFQIVYGDALLRRVTGLLREFKPDVVLTHAARDYLADHEETSRLVQGACFAAPVVNYKTPGGMLPLRAVPYLYRFDPVEGIDAEGRRVPAPLVVDVSSAIDTKGQMLACHESQREWLRQQHGVDEYLTRMKDWARLRGAESGFAFGEGLSQHLGHAFPKEDVIANALGPLVRRLSAD
jgi:LmbE family N-acetylglucosaminyl deacetylase